MLPSSLTACPERFLSYLIKNTFEVPASWEGGDELSAEGSARTGSALDSIDDSRSLTDD